MFASDRVAFSVMERMGKEMEREEVTVWGCNREVCCWFGANHTFGITTFSRHIPYQSECTSHISTQKKSHNPLGTNTTFTPDAISEATTFNECQLINIAFVMCNACNKSKHPILYLKVLGYNFCVWS